MEFRETEKEARLVRMNIAQADFFEPRDRLPIFFPLIVDLSELVTGMGELRIEVRRLLDIFFFLLRRCSQQSTHVVFFGIETNGRA